ncbi:PDDEXK family nuclease [Rothia terrae]|uniref:Restriction endonuclease n=1 Tax=Rothia terrae TaxID=396015 RepID=A0A7H2BDW0_9MICC|nr:hypothetical protein [Rothia terrae]QNV37856.1 hypothetical protein IDM49_00650 [Rothia terrae]
MKYVLHSHRYGLEIINNNEEFSPVFEELLQVIKDLDEEKFISDFKNWLNKNKSGKSVSTLINAYFKEELPKFGWKKEPQIFKDPLYQKQEGSRGNPWRLDFSYKDIFSMEVAFNNSGSIMANLIKPVLASELNHVEKQFQTKIGLVIVATQNFKSLGGFDKAVGTFENYILHLAPLMNQLTVPMVVIGLDSFDTFRVLPKEKGVREISEVVMLKTNQSIESTVLEELNNN